MEDFEHEFRHFLKEIYSDRPRGRTSVILSGSVSEMPIYYVSNNQTDFDFLLFDVDVCATEKPRSKCLRQVKQIQMETVGVPLGFARLKHRSTVGQDLVVRHPEPDSQEFEQSDHIEVTAHGCALKRIITYRNTDSLRWMQRALGGIIKPDTFKSSESDLVECIYCRDWPTVAKEFITRIRKHNWPSKETINEIVRRGCHLVRKSPHTDPQGKTVWRISFSMAETMLINSWTDTQRYVFHVLRIIKRRVLDECGGEEGTSICTYFFKTAMFWACEEKSSEFWKEENLASSLSEILLAVITDYLMEKRCPNYFIRGYDMMSHLQARDFTKEIRLFLEYHEQLKDLIENIPKSFPSVYHQVSIPNKFISFLLQVYSRHVNRFPVKLTQTPVLDFLDATNTRIPLRLLYRGIKEHYDLTLSGLTKQSNGRGPSLEAALNYFRLAVEFEDSGSRVDTVTSNETVVQCLERLARGVNDLESAPKGRSKLVAELQKHSRLLASFLPVSTYFVSAAYLANFSYTYLADYESAYRLCSSAMATIERIRNIFYKSEYILDCFAVLLSNRWTQIFDEHLQSVLGFVVLYKALIESFEDKRDTGSRSIGRTDLCAVVHLNPVSFLTYITWRCADRNRSLEIEPDFGDPLSWKYCTAEDFSEVILRAALVASNHFRFQFDAIAQESTQLTYSPVAPKLPGTGFSYPKLLFSTDI